MGLFSNKISRDELKAGDHIYSWRSYIYSHHGIYVGDGKVIHFTRRGGAEVGTGTYLDKIIQISVPHHGGDNPCPNCGDQSFLEGVISSCLDCFLSRGKLYRFEYNVSKAIFVAKQRGGTCTTAPSDPPEVVIHRAWFLLWVNGFGEYDLVNNNCEDFAIYCKTELFGLSVTKSGCSSQVSSVRAAVGGAAAFTLGIFGVRSSGQVASLAESRAFMVSAAVNVVTGTLGLATAGVGGMAVATYGKYCFSRLNYDVGVRPDVRKVHVEDLATVMQVLEGNLDDDDNNNNKKQM